MKKCKSCGANNADSAVFCTECGQSFKKNKANRTTKSKKAISEEKEKLTSKTWFVILMLFIFFPVGLYLMWKNNKFNLVVRIIITAFFALAIINSAINGSNSTSSTTTNQSVKETQRETVRETVREMQRETVRETEKPKSNKKSFFDFEDDNFELVGGINNTTTESDYFSTYIKGTVKNNSDKEYSYVQITFKLYDEDGSVVGTALDNVNNIGAGESWKFSAMAFEDFSSYKLDEITGW